MAREVQCCVCATKFWIDDDLWKLRQNDNDTFWCPLGHKQHFVRHPTDEEKKIAQLKQEVVWRRERILELTGDLEEARKTECHVCGKRFIGLSVHMARMHPEAWMEIIEGRISEELAKPGHVN